MNFRVVCFAFVLFLGLCCVAQRTKARPSHAASAQQESEAEDRQAIDKLQQDDIDGHLALDVDKIAGTWDDQIVTIPPHSKPIEGAAANRAYLETQRKTLANMDILGYEQNWNEVRLLGDYAYAWGVVRERLQPAAVNKELDLEYNVMRILKKEPDGSWKIYRQIYNDGSSGTTTPEQEKTPPKPDSGE